MKKRVAFLISGGGTNMAALIDSMGPDHLGAPVLVLSNRPDAKGLEKAAVRGVESAIVDHRPFGEDRIGFEAALERRLLAARIDVVAHAGFMRFLTAPFVARWRNRMLNIHPSLLPKYPGLNTHARALAAGDTQAGCSVHLVTERLDAGPVLGQARVPVLAGDTPERLAARVLAQEHRLYPAVLARFLTGNREPIFLD